MFASVEHFFKSFSSVVQTPCKAQTLKSSSFCRSRRELSNGGRMTSLRFHLTHFISVQRYCLNGSLKYKLALSKCPASTRFLGCWIWEGLSQQGAYASAAVLSQRVDEVVDRSVERSVDQSVGRSVDRSVDRMVDQTVEKSVDLTVDRSVDRSVDRTVDQSIDGRPIRRFKPVDRSGLSTNRSTERSTKRSLVDRSVDSNQ